MSTKLRTANVDPAASASSTLRRTHLCAGWSMLLVFLTLGLCLEALHAWKAGWYLDLANETRRLMFTLAHAHGTLVGLLHLGFGASVNDLHPVAPRAMKVASRLLSIGGGLLPAGFFLGGFFIHAGDPGLGVLLVPLGALLLIAAVGLCAQAAWRNRSGTPDEK